MNRKIALLACVALLSAPMAHAQGTRNYNYGSTPTGVLILDPVAGTALGTASAPLVTAGPTGATSNQVQGNVAPGSPVTGGNPIQIGGRDSSGNLALINSINGVADGVGGVQALATGNLVYNGTNFNRVRDITGAVSSGIGDSSVALAPHSVASGANIPTATAAVASALVVKASAGNLYGWRVTSGASAGYVLIFNAITAPADGAVTPLDCVPVAANASVGSGPFDIPERYTTGITVVFSTTGCFTKTASATAFIRATFQ